MVEEGKSNTLNQSIISIVRKRKSVLAAIIGSVVIVAFVTAAFGLHWFGGPSCGCGTPSTLTSSNVHFTVVMSLNGFNDSKIHGLPWPIMNVTVGQTVTIHLVNCDRTQSHGFSIGLGQSPTFVPSVTVVAGQCLDVSFLASAIGSFQVQCTIFCTVHFPWMLNGKFNVNP